MKKPSTSAKKGTTTALDELVLQSLEHEIGGTKIYAAALECVVHPALRTEWQRYLAETKRHVTVMTELCAALGIDANTESPGRAVVRHNGASLVEAMRMAKRDGDASAAQLVAAECVVLAETKDHLDWQLIGACADRLGGARGEALRAAYDDVEDQEDEHLYHSKGWCRELWLEALGAPAILPPPEERKKVKTAAGAAMAEQFGERLRRATHTST